MAIVNVMYPESTSADALAVELTPSRGPMGMFGFVLAIVIALKVTPMFASVPELDG